MICGCVCSYTLPLAISSDRQNSWGTLLHSAKLISITRVVVSHLSKRLGQGKRKLSLGSGVSIVIIMSSTSTILHRVAWSTHRMMLSFVTLQPVHKVEKDKGRIDKQQWLEGYSITHLSKVLHEIMEQTRLEYGVATNNKRKAVAPWRRWFAAGELGDLSIVKIPHFSSETWVRCRDLLHIDP
eukprot:1683612-Amphidinium_carterae.1